jgi:hypothetical protein
VSDAGLALTGQPPVSPATAVSLNEPASELWRALASAPGMQETIVSAVRELANGRAAAEFDGRLREVGVNALGGTYRDLCRDVADGQQRAMWDLLRATRQLGSWTTLGVQSTLDDIHDGPLAVLRSVAEEPTDTLAYHGLYADPALQVDESTIRLAVLRLADLDLVSTFDGPEGKIVELLAAGREYLDFCEREVDRQRQLSDAVSDSPNPSDENVYTAAPPEDSPAPPDGAGEDASRGAAPAHLGRAEHAAVAGAASGVDVAVCDHPVRSSGIAPLFSYDEQRDEVVAGAEYQSPLQCTVSVARALAGPWMWKHALTAERLDADGDLAGVLDGDRELWTRCSQGGWCSAEEDDAAEYVARLRAALAEIVEDTAEYRRRRNEGADDAADELARSLIRRSHGLIGVVTRLLDCCDVDLVRYVRIPEYASDFHSDADEFRRRRSILKTLAKATAVGSKHGAYTAERVLFEPRADKREFTLGAPRVDPGETGELIGSWVIAGRGVSKLLDPVDGPDLSTALRSPGELQEDGANYAAFSVPLSIRTDRDRDATAAAVSRLLAAKNLRPTRPAVNILAACCGSVFDSTRALSMLEAEPESRPRAIRLDEVRRSLVTLDGERLLADTASRSAGPLLKTMLETTHTLTTAELADRTDVSTQTVRNTTALLDALALIEHTPADPDTGTTAGWRCTLPDREERDTERGESIPWRLADGDSGGVDATERPFAVDFDHAVATLLRVLGDGPPPDFAGVIRDLPGQCAAEPTLRPWLRAAALLTGTTLDAAAFCPSLAGRSERVAFGEPPAQTTVAVAGAD